MITPSRRHVSRRTASRSTARVALTVGAVGAGIVLGASPASAHVSIQEDVQAADSYALLSFGVPHGCDESPTTKVRIQLPDSIPTATPSINPNWDIEIIKEQLDPPLETGHGEALTEGISEVVFTAKTPLEPGYRDDLKLTVHIPAEAAGTTLAFPTIQECVEGQTAWTQVASDGQNPDELESPAPTVTVTAATGDAHGSTDTEASTAAAAPESGDEETTSAARKSTGSDGDDSSGLAIAGLVTGILGTFLGGGALAASRRSAA